MIPGLSPTTRPEAAFHPGQSQSSPGFGGPASSSWQARRKAAALHAWQALPIGRPFGPWATLAVTYLLAAVLTEFMSNSAPAVLLAPVAIAVAASLGVDPRTMLMAVCFAASTSFCTPVGYQTNAMVQHPGGYRFADYLKIGLPLNVLFWLLSTWFIPKFWPF